MSKPKKQGAKYQCLRNAVTDFAVEIKSQYENADNESYGKAWRKLWRTVDAIGLFASEKK